MSAIAVERNLTIPLADGTVLSGDLYRPDDGRPHPALLNYYPYRKDDVIGSLFDGTRRRFVEGGYADLLVDMTGTGGSEGKYGEAFNLGREGRDAAQIVEWMAAQDWCDGNVGIWGVSYGGFIGFAAASERPPHLKAIVPVYATTDNRERLAPGGCLTCFGWYSWAAHMLAMDLLPPTFQDSEGRWRRVWHQRLERMAAELPHGLEWQVHPQSDEYWSAGRVDASRVEVPTLLIAGWRDAYTDCMLDAHGLVKGPVRLVVGPWMHVVPHMSDVEPWDWVGTMLEWWDRYLRPGGKEEKGVGDAGPPVLYFAQGVGAWRVDDKWPPSGTTEKTLFLVDDRLEVSGEPTARSRTYVGDPTVGVAGGVWDPFATGLGWPEDQGSDEVRSLVFTSSQLEAPLEIAGKPSVDLLVAVEGGGEAQLSVKLSAVSPDGRSSLITQGMWCSAAGKSGAGEDALAEAGARLVSVEFAQTCFGLRVGERLRLAVAAADFPHFWPTPTNPRMTVWTGGERPSRLRLPVSPVPEAGSGVAVEVARPPSEPDPGWMLFGKPTHTVERDEGSGRAVVSLGLRGLVKTPNGAVVSNDEIFSAGVEPQRPEAARLEGRSLFEIEMPGGEKVVVRTNTLYGRRASVCHGSVELDGVLIFEHSWSNWGWPG